MRIGRYQVQQPISSNDAVEVLRGRSFDGPEDEVVIKRFAASLSQDPQFAETFKQQARLAAGLEHANIVGVVDFGVDPSGCCYLASRAIDGRDLAWVQAEMERRSQNVPVAIAVYIIRRLCQALGYACNQAGDRAPPIIHERITPSNILISNAGEVKLVDFGMAAIWRAVEKASDGRIKPLTQYAYMAPEQVRSQPVDHRADLFAVGTLLHELVSGRPMFSSRSGAMSPGRVLRSRIPAPSQVLDSLPKALDRIVMRAMEREPDRRYQRSKDLFVDLQQFQKWGGEEAAHSREVAQWLSALIEAEIRPPEEDLLASAGLDVDDETPIAHALADLTPIDALPSKLAKHVSDVPPDTVETPTLDSRKARELLDSDERPSGLPPYPDVIEEDVPTAIMSKEEMLPLIEEDVLTTVSQVSVPREAVRPDLAPPLPALQGNISEEVPTKITRPPKPAKRIPVSARHKAVVGRPTVQRVKASEMSAPQLEAVAKRVSVRATPAPALQEPEVAREEQREEIVGQLLELQEPVTTQRQVSDKPFSLPRTADALAPSLEPDSQYAIKPLELQSTGGRSWVWGLAILLIGGGLAAGAYYMYNATRLLKTTATISPDAGMATRPVDSPKEIIEASARGLADAAASVTPDAAVAPVTPVTPDAGADRPAAAAVSRHDRARPKGRPHRPVRPRWRPRRPRRPKKQPRSLDKQLLDNPYD